MLFVALPIIVAGSLIGQWYGVMQRLGFEINFWFGHQGYEYVDLGRFWQIFLLTGLFIWLFLMGRAIWPAFKTQKDSRHLLAMFLISSIAIALFYGAGLMWGRQTNLAIAEYWRWWVALFGVYGMLGIGLMLFVLKGMTARNVWKEGTIKFAFWSINIGLALMVLISVLPIGLAQTWVSVREGLWYARSAEFMQQPVFDTIRWLRVIGDTLFAIGILALGWFVVGLKTGWSLKEEVDISQERYPSARKKANV